MCTIFGELSFHYWDFEKILSISSIHVFTPIFLTSPHSCVISWRISGELASFLNSWSYSKRILKTFFSIIIKHLNKWEKSSKILINSLPTGFYTWMQLFSNIHRMVIKIVDTLFEIHGMLVHFLFNFCPLLFQVGIRRWISNEFDNTFAFFIVDMIHYPVSEVWIFSALRNLLV